jgi:hypothetical protein
MKAAAKIGPGCYLYAIADAIDHVIYELPAVNGETIYSIEHGSLVALVSNISEKRVRPERKNLVAHHAATKRMMEQSTVLPMAFGTIAASPDAVLDILKKNEEAFHEQLERVRGKVEMGLRVTWDIPNIFEYFVNKHANLAQLRDVVMGKHRGPSQDDKIELGRLFDRLLAQDREIHAESVLSVLEDSCADVIENDLREEREVMHLACLVRRKDAKQFEDGVFKAASLFDNSYAFDFNGPWAPHHFVNIALEA